MFNFFTTQVTSVVPKGMHTYQGYNDVITFDNLPDYVTGGFSWGDNMMSSMDHHMQAESGETTRRWIHKLYLPEQIIRIVFESPHAIRNGKGIVAIRPEVVSQYKDLYHSSDVLVQEDFIYTKNSAFCLMVKPGDCPSAIIAATNKNGEHIVGIGHWGRRGVDEMNPLLGMTHLISNEGCDPKDIFIGIAPGIGPKYHTLTRDEIFHPQKGTVSKLPHWSRWGKYLIEPQGDDTRYHLDLLGRLLDLLHLAKIPKSNIFADTRDTYTLALKGQTFSHRASLVEGIPQGRMIVAAALKS